jgi:uncharacterized protein (TIGR02145 family)
MNKVFCALAAVVLTVGCGGGESGNGKLTTEVTPANAGTVSRNPDQTVYPSGITVNLEAKAASGYKFKEWMGVKTSTEKTISVAMAGNMKITAVFEKREGYRTVKIGGKDYGTIKIGNQTWMAENLNLETPNSWCYEGNSANCEKYGRLYTWDAAKGACPDGWHLPIRQEWNELVSFAGKDNADMKLKAGSPDWDGEDEFGFSALPGGVRSADGGFDGLGWYGGWWAATEGGASLAYGWHMGTGNAYVVENFNSKGYGLSVRCLQD